MRIRFLCILALAGLLLSPVAVQAKPAGSAAAVVIGVPGIVRIATPEPGSIDPALVIVESDWLIVNQLFSGLTRIDPVTKLPIPDLASSWSVSQDRKEYIFTLRGGLTWSNGAALTASDVRYGIIRSLSPSTGSETAPGLYPILNAYEFNVGITSNPNDVGVTVLSPTQVKFTLIEPASYFPAIMAQSPARPVPASAISAWGPAWTEPAHIVTSGPYRLAQWLHGDSMLLDKNITFYDTVNVRIPHVSIILTSETAAWSLFLTGAVDTATVPISETWWVRDDPALSPLLHDAPGGCNRYLGFNPALEPFDDPLVRKAFIAAVDRQGLIDDVLNGNPLLGGSPRLAQTFTAPGLFGFVDGVVEGVGIPYNPAQAQAWLAQAGYPDGVGLPPITLWAYDRPTHPVIEDYLQADWAANLNVNVSVEKLAWSEYIARINEGNWQLWRLHWCVGFSDASDFLHDAIVPVPGRFGGSLNSTYLSLLDQAATSDDNPVRMGYYRQAEEILVETDPFVLPLFFTQVQVLTRSWLHRTYPLPFDVHIRDWTLTFGSKTLRSAAACDGWILESTATSNVGGKLNATAPTFNLGDSDLDQQYRAVLCFDTSLLPDDAVVTKVQLKIHKAGLVGTNPFGTHSTLRVDIRKGAFSNAAALQLADFKAAASRNAVGTFGKVPANNWYTATLTNLAYPYLNKTGMTQFRLLFTRDDNDDLSADYMLFHSGNSPAAAYRPVLGISYYVP